MYSSTDGVFGDSKSLDTEIMDGAYYSNFGGAVIRHGEGPDVLGVLEAPDNHMPIGKADLTGRWACVSTGGSCTSRGEQGRGPSPRPGPAHRPALEATPGREQFQEEQERQLQATFDQRPEPRADSLQCRVTQPHVGQWIPSPMPPGARRVHRGWNTFGRAYPRAPCVDTLGPFVGSKGHRTRRPAMMVSVSTMIAGIERCAQTNDGSSRSVTPGGGRRTSGSGPAGPRSRSSARRLGMAPGCGSESITNGSSGSRSRSN